MHSYTFLVCVFTWRHVFRLQADLLMLTVGAREPGRGGECWFPPHGSVRVHIILEKLFLKAEADTEIHILKSNPLNEEKLLPLCTFMLFIHLFPHRIFTFTLNITVYCCTLLCNCSDSYQFCFYTSNFLCIVCLVLNSIFSSCILFLLLVVLLLLHYNFQVWDQ